MQDIFKLKQWFPGAKLGMFIHFGLYSAVGESSEWIMRHRKIPRADYGRLAETFNPSKFNARDWVASARSMGANYITFTSKHHDGFCLWDTAQTDFKITNTPFKRDILGELVSACHEDGMRIIIYYSLLDWRHPSYVNTVSPDWPEPRPEDKPDWPVYKKYIYDQVDELCSNYGRIDGIWWDVGTSKSAEEWGAGELYALINRKQPHAVVNSRAGIPADFDIGERVVGKSRSGRTLENCDSVGAKAWGYIKDEIHHSPEYLAAGMASTLLNGCNYLLNVAPSPDGSIGEPFKARLKALGGWLSESKDALIGAEPCPLVCHHIKRRENIPLGLCSQKGNKIHILITERLKMDAFSVFGLETLPAKIRIVNGPELSAVKFDFGIEIRGIPFEISATAMPWTIEMSFESSPVINERTAAKFTPGTFRLRKGRKIELQAGSAKLCGADGCVPPLVRLTDGDYNCTGWWTRTDQYIQWDIRAESKSSFEIFIDYEMGSGNKGVKYSVSTAGNLLRGVLRNKAGLASVIKKAGTITLPKGLHTLAVHADHIPPGNGFADIRRIILNPAGFEAAARRK